MSQLSSDGALPQELVRQITLRLRPVCPDIPEPELRRLVEEVARVKLKHDGDEVAEEGQLRAAGGMD